ncbi:hypothetical protein D3C78_704230 [compost metagenome]
MAARGSGGRVANLVTVVALADEARAVILPRPLQLGVVRRSRKRVGCGLGVGEGFQLEVHLAARVGRDVDAGQPVVEVRQACPQVEFARVGRGDRVAAVSTGVDGLLLVLRGIEDGNHCAERWRAVRQHHPAGKRCRLGHAGDGAQAEDGQCRGE